MKLLIKYIFISLILITSINATLPKTPYYSSAPEEMESLTINTDGQDQGMFAENPFAINTPTQEEITLLGAPPGGGGWVGMPVGDCLWIFLPFSALYLYFKMRKNKKRTETK